MIKKVVLLLFIFIIVFAIYPNPSKAADDEDIFGVADNFIKDKPTTGNVIVLDEDNLKGPLDTIYNIFLTIGVVVAVIYAAILGIKFMTGSIEAQAKVKESILPFVMGCIVIFGAFGIWRLVVTIGNNLAK